MENIPGHGVCACPYAPIQRGGKWGADWEGESWHYSPRVSRGGLSPSPFRKEWLVKSKGRGGFWGHAMLCPKVVTDEGQRARAFAKSGLGCWLFFPWLEPGQLTL